MPITRRSFLYQTAFGTAAGAALIASPALAATPPVYTDRRGTAVDGSDVVAYFTQGEPVKGRRDITHQWNGATWRFSTEEHRAAFAAAPEAYAPQYGGYCAWAVSQGYTASTIPEAWKIVDGKLYLNYSRGVQRRWEVDIPARIAEADANWPAVLT
ncbi:MAG: YHS domain-containing (seleno)protein [Pseudomonadota bacterium]